LNPFEARVERDWFQSLHLKYDILLSNFAFNLNLRHYHLEMALQLDLDLALMVFLLSMLQRLASGLDLACQLTPPERAASGLDLVGLDMAGLLTPPRRAVVRPPPQHGAHHQAILHANLPSTT
jgi:hypothetical protein